MPEPTSYRLCHLDAVSQLKFTPDSRQLATASHDGTLRLWNLHANAPSERALLNEPTLSIAVDGKGRLATGGDDGALRLWMIESGELLRKWALEESIASVALADAKDLIAAGHFNGAAYQWNASTGAPYGAPIKFDGGIGDVAYGPDAMFVVAQSKFGNVQLWDTVTMRPAGLAFQHPDPTGNVGCRVVFSPDGKRLAATINSENAWEAVIFNLPGLQPTIRLPSGSNVFDVAFLSDGKTVATASADNTIRIWDANSGEALTPPVKQDEWVTLIAVFSDGVIMATGSTDATMLWETGAALPLGPPFAHGGEVREVELSYKDHLLITATENGVTLRNLPTPPENLREIELHTWLALGARLNENGVITTIKGREWRELQKEFDQLELEVSIDDVSETTSVHK